MWPNLIWISLSVKSEQIKVNHFKNDIILMLHVTLTKSTFQSFFGMDVHVYVHNTWIKKYMYSP